MPNGWFPFERGDTAVEFGGVYLAHDGERVGSRVYASTEVHRLVGIKFLMNIRDLPKPTEKAPQ